MGDGKKLKEILDSKNTNVRQIAKATEISATTLYSIIQKDSNIRFNFALRLANELEIDVNEICAANPFSGAITEEEIYPTLPDGLKGALQVTVSQGQRAGRTSKANKRLVKIQTPMKLGTNFIGVLFYGTVQALFYTFSLL